MAQMRSFFTSEILVLPKQISSLDLTEQLAEKVQLSKELIMDYLSSKKEFATTNNISFFNLEHANFPIEEIRRMQIEAEYSSSLSGQAKRVFVLCNFDTASIPAQNAALKIIEESPADTLILLLVDRKERILETIISRCLVIDSFETKFKQTTPAKINFSWPKNYSQAILLAEQNKDRHKALKLVENLLATNLSRQKKETLLSAYQALLRNQNVQLVLENCFFSLVSLES